MPQYILDSITKKIAEDFQLFPVVATEIEFYLHGAAGYKDMSAFLDELGHACSVENLDIHAIQKERGAEQYEIALQPGVHPLIVAEDTIRLKETISRVAQKRGLKADFSAKPFLDQPGSGLHVHVNLVDGMSRNVFFRENDSYSVPLLYAIGGMLITVREAMPFFAPSLKSYDRFVAGYNVPVTISWGANNRTVAIRLPAKPAGNKHAEHRVSGADASPDMVIAAILAGVHYGITHRIKPPEQIFGDASLPMYKLEHLPKDIKSALQYLQQGRVLPTYFGEPFCREYIKSRLHMES